jgi:hypothetical protein
MGTDMLENNNKFKRFESGELVLMDISHQSNSKLIDQYYSKIKSMDVAQVKVYMGVAYFVLASVLTLSLFF